MKQEEILKFVQKSIYDTAKHIGKWKGFEVWEPGFSDGKPRFLGFPQFILVKGDAIKWNEDDNDSRAIMNALW